MWHRALSAGIALLLASCSLTNSKTGEGPERIESQPEVIQSVEAELPPRTETAKAEAPVHRIDPFAEERPYIGQDPRISESRASSKAPKPTLYKEYKEPIAPMAGRVGIMSLVGNQLRHVHASTFGGHQRDYIVQFNLNGYINEELRKALLSQTPYQPVPVAPTGFLRQAADTWQETWDGKQFADRFQREFDGIIKQNRLSMLIIVSYARIDDGQFIGGAKLSGSGLYTRSSFGKTKSAVFSTFQFYRLVGSPAVLVEPVEAPGVRSIGDLPDIPLPDDLENMPARYLVPVYGPLRQIVGNKINGLISFPRKLGK